MPDSRIARPVRFALFSALIALWLSQGLSGSTAVGSGPLEDFAGFQRRESPRPTPDSAPKPPKKNTPPKVNGGPAYVVQVPGPASLRASISDDGLPTGNPLTVLWTKRRGPGAVTFATPTKAETQATFSKAGLYVLRVTASDGELTAADDVVVVVHYKRQDQGNRDPKVDAGPDQTIVFPATATLNGTVTDDDRPQERHRNNDRGRADKDRDERERADSRKDEDEDRPKHDLSILWTQAEGPGKATFADRSAPKTTASFSEPGLYVLRLYASDGEREGFDEVKITVKPAPAPTNLAPVVDAGVNQAVTLPGNVTLDGTVTDDGRPASGGPSSAWTQASGPGIAVFATLAAPSTTVSLSQAGVYVLRLTATDGELSAFDEVTITVSPAPPPPPVNRAPSANAGGPYAAETAQPITFAGSGSDPDGDPLTFTWDFGDGASGNGASAAHTYATAGPYTATLTVNDGRGGITSATASVTITTPPPPPPVNRAPSANAGGPYAAETAQPITFAGSGSDPDGDALTFTWDFGDGASGNGASAAHAYTSAGPYTATLTVNDGRGGITSATASVTITTPPPPPPVNRAPSANAGGPYAAETAQPITFAGSGSDPDGDPLTFTWDFGDGASGNGASAAHTYASAGPYTATLTVNDGRGGITSATASVTITTPPPPPPVNRAPSANAGGPYAAETAQPITFAGSGSDPDGDALTFTWDFGDGASGNGASAAHTYATAGPYTATLTVNDGRGGITSATASVTITTPPPPPPVNRAPSANAGGPYAAETAQPITFAGSGSDPDGDALTFTWDFGDGASGNGASAAHTYATAGPYTATLTVNDGRGGITSATASVTITTPPPPPPVNRAPSANAGGPYAAETAQPITFAGSGSDPDGDALTFTWDFGDGASGNGASAAHAYTSAGPYTATLTVSDGRGGIATTSASVTIVAPAPNRSPNFTSDPVTAGAHQRSYAYQALANDPDGDVLRFSLADGPAGMTIGAANGLLSWIPSGTQLGVFNVTLAVNDPRGGASTQTFAITVVDLTAPVVTLTLPSEALPGAVVTATALATDNIGVSGLRFEVNGADPIEQASGPFQRAITVPANALVGTEFHVRATARDAAGNTGQADRVFRVAALPDVQPPTLRFNVPSEASPGAAVRLSATVTDNVGVKSVVFRVGDTPIVTDSEAPFEAAFTVPVDAVVGSTVNFAARVFDFSDNFTDAVGALNVVATPDTTPPTVQLVVAPTVPEGGTATLLATAADNLGIASVSFFVNGVNVGSVTNAPYSMPFKLSADLAGGTVMSVEARALDFSGLAASSLGAIEVLASPNRAPTASAGGPYAGEVGQLIRLSAAASSDPDSSDHLSYDWDFGDQTTGSGLSPSHAYETEGAFTLVVTVSDGRGGASTGQATVVVAPATDRDPPSVTLNGPASVLPGSQVTITALATDDRGIAGVAFEVNGSAPTDTPGPPYQRVVDVPPVASPGNRIVVKATARDAAGNQSTAERTLTIGSAPDTERPVVAINAPPSIVGGSMMRVSATVSDNVGVQFVSFTVNGVVIATLPGPPFEASYPVSADAPAGSSIGVVVQATDFSGNRGEASGAVAVVALADGDTTPPSINLSAPLQVYAGRTVTLSAQAQDNVGIASVGFFVNGVNVATLTGPPFAFTYTVAPAQVAGTVLNLRAEVVDLSGSSASDTGQTLVVPPASAGQGVLTGEVYDDGAGLPLAGATVRLVGTDSTGEAYAASTVSDARGRWVLRATEGQGVVQITSPGWTRVDRPSSVVVDQALELFDARLTLLSAPATSVSAVLGGAITWPAGPGPPAQLTVPPGALPTATSLALTPLTQQGLEGLLPAGWSPVAMAEITPRDVSFATGATLSLPNAFSIADGVTLVIARWDEEAAAWRAVGAIVSPASGPLVVEIPRTGQFVLLKPDLSPLAPPFATAGDLIEGISPSALALDASAVVDPQPRVLFYRPGIRSEVHGTITAAGSLSSGLPIEGHIVESYSFLTGASVRPESFVEDVVFYQVGGPASGLGAVFGVTPSQAFDPLTLRQGVITVELFAPPVGPRVVSTFGPDGGSAAAQSGETLRVPQGAVANSLPVSVRGLAPANFGVTLPPGINAAGAALVTFSGTLDRPATLSIPRPAGLADSARLLLVRPQEIGGETRLVLVGRGVIVGGQILSDTTLNGADVFEGVRVGGRYLFVSATSAFGFARGQVSGAAGGPFAGALVSASGFPIVSISGSAGGYVAAAAVGSVALTATDLVNADSGSATGDLASAGAVLPLDVQIAASVPRVTAIVPADGALNVPLSDPIVVRFSKAIAAASINGANAGNVRLVPPDGTPVSASISLSGAGNIATLRPATALQSNTAYTVVVATGVTDVAGRSLSAEVTAHFTSLDTEPPPMPAAGSIAAAIPGADGFTTVTATQGTAATHDTVTVVNLTRRTTSPVLLDPNGGFTVRVAASLTDKLQIAITDANGNQTVVPLARFTRTNGDGSVSVFVGAEGGRVEGAGGTAATVASGTFPEGAIVTIKPVSESAFPVQLSPENRAVFRYAGGFEIDFDGAVPTRYVDVSIPPAPGDTADDQWLVSQVVQINGQPTLNVADTARLIESRVATSSPPCPGVLSAGVYGVHKSSRLVGKTFGTLAPQFASGSLLARIDSTDAGAFLLDFVGFTRDVAAPVCLPVLSGRVTVTANTVNIGIRPEQLASGDELIRVKNVTTTVESRFNRDDLAYSFAAPGVLSDHFSAVTVSAGSRQVVEFRAVADGTGAVRILIPLQAIAPEDTDVEVLNLKTFATVNYPRSGFTMSLSVSGGMADMYEAVASNIVTGDRPLTFAVSPSALGSGNLVLRALPTTIDPTRPEMNAHNAAHPSDPPLTGRARTSVSLIDLMDPLDPTDDVVTTVPPTAVVDGGITWAFDGDQAHKYRVQVWYDDSFMDFIDIPVFRIVVTNAAGTPVKIIVRPSPPRDSPLDLGRLTDDTTPPVMTTPLRVLQHFDPSGNLTITFDESMDVDSIRANFRVVDAANHPVPGELFISNANRGITFVPTGGLALGAHYTVRLAGLVDRGGNPVDPSRQFLSLNTFAPSMVAELRKGTNPATRPLGGLKDIQILRRQVAGVPQTTLVAVTDASPLYKFVMMDVTNPLAPVDVGRELGGSLKQRVTLLTGVSGLTLNVTPTTPNTCAPGGATFSGDLALTATDNPLFSFVSFYDVTDRAAPCLMGGKLLSANPETLSDFSRTGTVRAVGHAKGVAALQHVGGYMAYTAVADVGLFATDIGRNIPEVLPLQRTREPMLPGDYVDVAAVSNRLVALNRGERQLEVIDPGLAVMAVVGLSGEPSRMLYVPRLPFDANGDRAIGSNEFIDAAVVVVGSQIVIVDLTNIEGPQVVGTIPLPATILDVDVDRAKVRLVAASASAWYIVDLAKSRSPGLMDANGDGVDDRVVWTRPSANGVNTVEADPDTSHIYVGTEKGLEVYRLARPGLEGIATFTYIPAKDGIGLDYAHAEPRPIRGAIVELRSGGSVIATTNTNEVGYYAFDAPAGANVEVVVRAELGTPGLETVKVVDNKNGYSTWKVSSGVFPMPAATVRDIYAETEKPAPHYGVRTGAPFAILDLAYQAQDAIRRVDPTAAFPLLKMAWSEGNLPALDPAGNYNYPAGFIKTSHYSLAEVTLYILGAQDLDTDEYDAQVVLHEWAHYFEHKFSRSDTIGGRHASGDVLDPRVAFGEGFATAFASMITKNPNYVDTTGLKQAIGNLTDVESDNGLNSSFFSEDAVMELLWDLYDGKSDEFDSETLVDIKDEVELGFEPIYRVMTHDQKTTNAFTTIFSFLHSLHSFYEAGTLKAEVGDKIVAMAKAENIDLANADEFELFNTVTVDGFEIGRLYTEVPPDGVPVEQHGPGPKHHRFLLTRVDHDLPAAGRPTGDGNKLDEHVFFKFTIATAGKYVVAVTATGTNAADERLWLRVNLPGGMVGNFAASAAPGTIATAPVELKPGTYTASVSGVIWTAGKWFPGPGTVQHSRPAVTVGRDEGGD